MQSNVTHTVNPPLGNTKMYNNSKVPSFYGQRMTILLYINVAWYTSDELDKNGPFDEKISLPVLNTLALYISIINLHLRISY